MRCECECVLGYILYAKEINSASVSVGPEICAMARLKCMVGLDQTDTVQTWIACTLLAA